MACAIIILYYTLPWGNFFRSANVTGVYSPKRDAIYRYSTPDITTVFCKHPLRSDIEMGEHRAKQTEVTSKEVTKPH
jgi:hypothetical protein